MTSRKGCIVFDSRGETQANRGCAAYSCGEQWLQQLVWDPCASEGFSARITRECLGSSVRKASVGKVMSTATSEPEKLRDDVVIKILQPEVDCVAKTFRVVHANAYPEVGDQPVGGIIREDVHVHPSVRAARREKTIGLS